MAALERLDERRRAEWLVEEQRAEMAAIDESAIAGWLADAVAQGPSRHDIGVAGVTSVDASVMVARMQALGARLSRSGPPSKQAAPVG